MSKVLVCDAWMRIVFYWFISKQEQALIAYSLCRINTVIVGSLVLA